jgi:hypothetical protein
VIRLLAITAVCIAVYVASLAVLAVPAAGLFAASGLTGLPTTVGLLAAVIHLTGRHARRARWAT